MKYLIYCTKAKPYLNDYRKVEFCEKFVTMNKKVNELNCNGKIVAEFDGEIEPIVLVREKNNGALYSWHEYHDINISNENECDLLKESCLTLEQIEDYLPFKPFKIKTYGTRVTINDGYAIHINDLKIFDKPKELSDYMPICKGLYDAQEYHNFFFGSQDEFAPQVEKAPQNMMYVSSNGFDKLCLISIRPQWVEKILNGEKTIEIRRKVLRDCL